ncbi:methyltransferase domain-containing protein [Candidatus Pelagibacter sp.]|nr:methyltransferase domain-containing protein [Candidatus Pelagibacter sp.]
MKQKKLITYWNKFYKKKIISKESTFAKFTYKKINNKKDKILDIGCGNGRDSFFFNQKGYNVTGIDISQNVIQKNSKMKIKDIIFKRFDIGNDKAIGKFGIIYCRFFLHTVDYLLEKKLINLIKNSKKRGTIVFFEFRNFKDKIFGKFKASDHNKVVEFEKGHFRRIIDPKIFKRTFIKETKAEIIYEKSGINLSIVKNDNPNLSRMIFKF